MTVAFELYLNKFPEDFELFLKGLGNNFRLSLALLLLENGNLSLKKITDYTKKSNSSVLNHLKKLELGGIVQNFLKKSEETNEYSFYELTKFGKRIIYTLLAKYNKFLLNYPQQSITLSIPNLKKSQNDLEFTFKSLANKFRFCLALYLIEEGPFSFSEVVKLTNRKKSLIASHLKKLELGGIIQNYFRKNEKKGEYSFYESTNYGTRIITYLSSNFPHYQKNINNSKDLKDQKIKIGEVDKKSFVCGCATWALPNERILGWIEMFSKEIFKIEIKTSKLLRIKEIFNAKFDFDKDNNVYTIISEDKKLKYLSFEFYSEIPETNNAINIENLNIIAYNKTNQKIDSKELKVEILKPIVKLEVQNKHITSNSGFFEIKILILKGFQIEIPAIEIKVEDQNNRLIEIETQEKDPIDFEQDIPPGIKLDNLIGRFKLNGIGDFNFHFRIPYYDILKNHYYSNVETILIKNAEKYEGSLSYVYDHSLAIAET